MSAVPLTRRWPPPICSALTCACMLLASCLPAADHSSSPPPTVVVFKHGKLSGDPQVLSGLLREFEQAHPGVTVREEILPSSTDQQHQFYAINLEGKSVPFDLLAVDVIWVQEFARAGWIQPVDQGLPDPERKTFVAGALESATYEARLYALPWYVDAGVLYYRRDLLERYGFAPPKTWPELARITRAILDREQDPDLRGFLWQGKQYEGLVCVALEFVRGHGGGLLGDRNPEGEAALGYMRTLVEERLSPSFVTTADEEATRHLFGAGRAVFMRNWPYAWSLLQAEGSPVRGKIGLAPVPSFPGHESVPTLGGWMLAVPERAPHPLEAKDLLRYLASSAIQKRLALELGYLPGRSDLYQDSSLLEAKPWLAALSPVILRAKPRPVTPYYLMISQVLQPELSAVVVGLKTPEAALVSARRQIDRILGAP
ncbi:ABC transporter substrate-binding protein [Nitrospira sp. NS4]|uniref:ABC transporter substrate-binding protein n=1 Tax=Nitrospira sp. NS4 TaxID=3414498 RepID=UPI003C2CEEE6